METSTNGMKGERQVRDTFDRLYDEYHHSLFQFVFYMVRNREIAEELVQEAYIKVLKSYDTFEGNSSEKTWIYSIARHVAIDYLRKESRRSRKVFGLMDIKEKEHQLRHPAPLPDEIASQNESIRKLYEAIGKCKEDQQQVIILRFIQSFSINETAAILGWSESKVKTTQHRTIKALRTLLEGSLDKEALSNGTF
jgi:RNA polymerase sigma-70 factor (ECF subfamily)